MKPADARVEQNRALEDELTGRAYTAYHHTQAELVKLFNNNKRHIDTYFLN